MRTTELPTVITIVSPILSIVGPPGLHTSTDTLSICPV